MILSIEGGGRASGLWIQVGARACVRASWPLTWRSLQVERSVGRQAVLQSSPEPAHFCRSGRLPAWHGDLPPRMGRAGVGVPCRDLGKFRRGSRWKGQSPEV